MIRNSKELATNIYRKHMLEILEVGLDAAMPEKAVKQALKFDGQALYVLERKFPVKGKVVVIGFGKASARIARAV